MNVDDEVKQTVIDAALTAGINGTWVEIVTPSECISGLVWEGSGNTPWNSYFRNEDALWLLARIQLDVEFGDGSIKVYNTKDHVSIDMQYNDPAARESALRQAITLAAAIPRLTLRKGFH